MKKILILNGSINGQEGNTSTLLDHCSQILQNLHINFEVLHLHDYHHSFKEKMKLADGFIFATGTYWDSWGSPMQKFLEEITDLEAEQEILFKPASVIVTMHAFGGKSVLSRLQGVLNTMGMIIPPMSGMVYALSTQQAMAQDDHFAKDFWSIEDLEIVLHNLVTTTKKEYQFKPWPVDKKDPKRLWLKTEN